MPTPSQTATAAPSKLDLELAKRLTLLENLDLLESFDLLELLPLLEEDTE